MNVSFRTKEKEDIFQMEEVAKGRKILFDWYGKTETSAFLGFTLPNGNTIFEYHDLPMINCKVQGSWATSKFNPWVDRVNEITMTSVETGYETLHKITPQKTNPKHKTG